MFRDTTVEIVQTEVANIASVSAAFKRANCKVKMCESSTELTNAQFIVLPGVGSFAAATSKLNELGLKEALIERINSGKPTLSICLGLQLLASSSEEAQGVAGLGIFNESISKFPNSVRVPQIGWNKVEVDSSCKYLQSGYAYFANSYRLESTPTGWSAAYADHGGKFVAAIEREGVLACQFHPELSSDWGHNLLTRWLLANGGR